MKFIYPAIFRKTDQNTYEGYFPDLECCRCRGNTLDEAVNAAIAAEREWISAELEEEDAVFPAISDAADLKLGENETLRNIGVNIRMFEGWDE